jgi:hypothetical protein
MRSEFFVNCGVLGSIEDFRLDTFDLSQWMNREVYEGSWGGGKRERSRESIDRTFGSA